MKLMLSNDDGVHAQGLAVLAKALEQAGYSFDVVAPTATAAAPPTPSPSTALCTQCSLKTVLSA